MRYKHLFFDLDHTLWDFERNSSESLEELFSTFSLGNLGLRSSRQFVQAFLKINTALWDSFDRGIIHHTYIRENRFKMVFQDLGVACPECHLEIGEAYLQSLPTKHHLLDGALEVLNYVSEKGYKTHIITNGFNDIQAKKIASSDITHFFEHVVTFETASAKKPDPKIFQYALALAGADLRDSVMIGDNWIADILGAKKAGMDTVYYNPAGLQFEESATYDIRKLEDLKLIF
jgi:putative hydrolase of the HAD superfamily